MAAQEKACFDFLNWSTCVAWHSAHVSGVGSFTLATSSFDWWSDPWQVSHETPFRLCFESFQSETMLGVVRRWHVTQCEAPPLAAAFGFAEGLPCASAAGAARVK